MGDTTIERTIYKLEIDDSAYIAGVDKLSASTSKLSTEQDKANAKLAELNKLQQSYKKSLEETTAVLKANEKETIDLTKDLNLLKESEKGTSAEAEKLKASLRGIAVSTKEFKAEAAVLKTNIAATTNEIKIQTKELQAGEKAHVSFTGGLQKVYTGLQRIAYLIPGIGIGGLVALIAGPLVNVFGKWFDAIGRIGDRQKIFNDITESAIKNYAGEVSKLDIIRGKLNDLNIPQEKRLALAKEYNKTAEESNKIDLAQIDNIALVNAAIDSQIEKIKQRGLARAAETIIAEKAEKFLQAQEEARLKNLQFSIDATKDIAGRKGNLMDQYVAAIEQKTFLAKQIEKDPKVIDAKKALDDALSIGAGFISIEGLTTDKGGKKEKARKEITNIYEQELQKLKADIAKLDEKGFTNEASITKGIEEDFKKRSLAFEKAFKNKQLTAGQLTSLNGYLKDLQTLTLAQNLKVFREQKAAYLKQINDELENLQIEENTKRISAIQDRFERERQTIISETEKTENAIRDKRDKLITDITKNAAKSGLTPADIAPQIESIKTLYSKLLDDLEIIKLQKLQQLSFDTFEKLSEDAKRLLESGNLGVSQGSLINIKAQTQLFLEGKISYEKYQKELTAITRFEANERFRLDKLFLEQEIKLRKDKLASDKSLTDEQIKKLEDEIRRLQQQLTDAEKGNAITGAGNTEKDKNDKLTAFVKYAQAIGDLTSKVISFWQKTNEAEAAALDRSIALQEKRVDAAQKIADRGNAQYLKAETDRLAQLQVQRENAARKQLGINAALQGSEILVSLITGIAQGVKLGGPLGAIAALAAVVAAIAGAFAIAQSLKPPEPSFFVGTTDTGKGGNVDGKGGFRATLHPNEAVTSAEKNKAYHPVIKAIHAGTIPPEQLNAYVNHYHRIKPVPQVNYQRIKEAAELKIMQDGHMAVSLNEQNKLIQENTEVQRQVLKTLHKMGVNVSLDSRGFAVTQMEVIRQMEIDKKV